MFGWRSNLLRRRDSLILGNRGAIVIKHIRIDVGAVGPDNCAQFLVNAHLREFGAILPERLEDWASQAWFKVDNFIRVIGKTKFHLMIVQNPH